jgi:hypothetical protein
MDKLHSRPVILVTKQFGIKIVGYGRSFGFHAERSEPSINFCVERIAFSRQSQVRSPLHPTPRRGQHHETIH